MDEGRQWSDTFKCFHLVMGLYRGCAGIELPDPEDELLKAARAGDRLFRTIDPEAEPIRVGDLLRFQHPEDGPHLALVEAEDSAVQVTSRLGIFRASVRDLILFDDAKVLRYEGPGEDRLER